MVIIPLPWANGSLKPSSPKGALFIWNSHWQKSPSGEFASEIEWHALLLLHNDYQEKSTTKSRRMRNMIWKSRFVQNLYEKHCTVKLTKYCGRFISSVETRTEDFLHDLAQWTLYWLWLNGTIRRYPILHVALYAQSRISCRKQRIDALLRQPKHVLSNRRE